jgi:hypothetical protein
MSTFRFAIEGSMPFADDVELPSDEAAWREALQLVRDIEGSLRPAESWTLTITEEGELVFCIRVETATLRAGRKPRHSSRRAKNKSVAKRITSKETKTPH